MRIFRLVGWVCSLSLSAGLSAQIELPKPIQGVYRVDAKGTGPDVFRDLSTAVRYISLVGIGGDVELVVAPGTYQGSLVLFPIAGQKAGQKIRIRANGQGPVRLESEAAIVRLMRGCHHVSLQGFTFAGSGSQPAVMIDDGVTDIEIRDCRFLRETGGNRVIEVQGKNTTRRIDIHHNSFQLDGGHRYGIYTQGTIELFVHHNDFECDGAREPISIWNSNQSKSRIYDNVFRGSLSSTCVRLDVSGHDVDVYRNLFLLQIEGAGVAVIASQGMANRSWNRIHHNIFVVLGTGVAIRTRGPLAVNSNSYAVEGGVIGQVRNTSADSLEEWREAVAEVAVDEAADQDSVAAAGNFFTAQRQLLDLLHRFDDAAVEPAGKVSVETQKARQRDEVRFLVKTLTQSDPVALRLAMRALRRHGRLAAPAVPALGRLCGHRHAPVRADAATALGEIRIGAEVVIPELIKLLGDQDRLVLLAALATLRQFAHLARQAAPALQTLVEHADPAVQAAARQALAAVTGK